MNQCYGCTTCESADKPLEGFIKNLPLETSHHRVEGQSTKCAFGLQGVCCRLCSNGPCRITPDAPRGICGANADTIVARNFLRAVASGSGCYIHVVENTARNVKNAAQKKSGIKGEGALNKLAALFEIEEEDMYVRAEKVADAVLADLYLPEYEKMKLVKKMGSLSWSCQMFDKLKFRSGRYVKRLFETWNFYRYLRADIDESSE